MELDGCPAEAHEVAALGLHNYGHFTTMVVEQGHVRGLSLHLRRLLTDCRTLFAADLDPDRLRGLIRQACTEPAVIARVTIFAPDLDLASPSREVEPHVLVTTTSPPARDLPALRVRTVRYRRDLPQVKHTGLFATVLLRRRAQLDGFHDVVFVDDRGRICEGATWNIGFVEQDRVVWPAADCLPGVTMQQLREANPLEMVDSTVDLEAARHMRCAFATNAANGIRAIASIDDVTYAAGDEAIVRLRQAYLAVLGEPL